MSISQLNGSSIDSTHWANYEGAITADTLLAYMSQSLSSVDDQINEIFERQKKAENVREVLNKLKTYLNSLEENPDKKGEAINADLTKVEDILEELATIDPKLAKQMKTALEDELILNLDDSKYNTTQLEASKEYLDGVFGQLDSSTQMDMIFLQSKISTKERNFSLGTNLIAKNDQMQMTAINHIGR